jgi:hypothetical protein
VQSLEAAPGGVTETRYRTRQRGSVPADQQKEQELKRKRDEAAAKERTIISAQKKAEAIAKERANLAEREKEIEAGDEPTRKRSRRKDVTSLVRVETPRLKAQMDGPSWNPPSRLGKELVYTKPGTNWKKLALQKLQLLTLLRHHLTSSGLLTVAMTFPTLMDFIQLDDDLDFNSRVFIYLLALMLGQKRYGIGVLLAYCKVLLFGSLTISLAFPQLFQRHCFYCVVICCTRFDFFR